MSFWREVLGLSEPVTTAAEPTRRYLVVTKPSGVDYFDSDTCQPHCPDPQTLVIQRDHRSSPMKHYGPRGWLSFHWEDKTPSSVAYDRGDVPRKPRPVTLDY